ncbi:AraC family transcriptional regulator, partial [Pseudomonas syringae]
PLLQQVMAPPAVVHDQHARKWLDVLCGSIAQDHARRSIGDDLPAQAAQAQLVIWLARTALERARHAAAISPQADPALRPLRAYQGLIDQHYRAHWPISRYADQLGLTPGHLNALCQRLAGASALQLLQRRIMLEARRTLRYTSLS